MNEDEQFVEQYRPLVCSIANKLRNQFDLKIEPDDLIQFGYRGLLEARSRFDSSRGVKFNTFAYYRIRGAIMDGVREMAYLPRRVHALMRAAEGADRALEDAGDATTAARAQGASLSPDDAAGMLDDLLGKMAASYVMSAVGQGEDAAPATPEERLLDATAASAMREAVMELPDRERALVEGFYFEGRRFDEVAEDLGISKSWASRLHAKALRLLRDKLS